MNYCHSELLAEFQKNPEKISKWIENDIVIRDDENYYNVPLTPAGVLRLGVSDTHSRKILFVAICRTLGIPSRLEPGTNRPQYFQSGEWVDVWFTGDIKPADKRHLCRLIQRKNRHHLNITFILPLPGLRKEDIKH